jgi:prepilin-type N-terminal cleavage/methylation domain-containing protein
MKQRNAGFTMTEMMVALTIIGILGALAISSVDKSALNLSSAEQDLMATLRLARASANGRGVHFCVTISASSYTIQRLKQDAAGNWIVDTAFSTQTMTAPRGISFSVTQGDGVVEFDTRGLVVPPPGQTVSQIEGIRISDSIKNRTKNLNVWPSGQVLEV